jgi:hypothetical protein
MEELDRRRTSSERTPRKKGLQIPRTPKGQSSGSDTMLDLGINSTSIKVLNHTIQCLYRGRHKSVVKEMRVLYK